MADEIDRGQERDQWIRDLELRRRKPAGPQPCGQCHNCDAYLEPWLAFCDSFCRDDWELRQNAESRHKRQAHVAD